MFHSFSNLRFNVHPSGRVIEFENGGCPYSEHLFELEEEQGIEGQILYAVFADTNRAWRVMCVPVRNHKFESRLLLPAAWRALRDEELSAASDISECIFVHASGFIGGNKTKDGALKMAAKALIEAEAK